MPCPLQQSLVLPLKRVRAKNTNKISKNKNFKAITQYLNLKAPSNNVKMQSDKTLTTQSYPFLTIQQMKTFHNETR